MEITLFCNLIMGMTSHCLCWIHYFQKQVTRSSLHIRAGDYTRPWIPLVGNTGGHLRSASCKGSRAHAWTWAPLDVHPLALSSHKPLQVAEQKKEQGCWRIAFQLSNWLYNFMHDSVVFSFQGLCLFTCKSRVLGRDHKTISFFPVPILNGWPWISGASYWERFHWCAGASFHVSNRLCIQWCHIEVSHGVNISTMDIGRYYRQVSYPHMRAGC